MSKVVGSIRMDGQVTITDMGMELGQVIELLKRKPGRQLKGQGELALPVTMQLVETTEPGQTALVIDGG